MKNSVGILGRSAGARTAVLVGLGALIAIVPVALSQQAPPRAQPAKIYKAGGAFEVGTATSSGIFVAPTDPVAIKKLAEMRAVLDKVTPVTDAMLRNPPANDWLMWRRSYDSWAYSPLNQINRTNVKNLAVAWSMGLASTGVYEFTPIVHDGIMFVWSHGENVSAVDARNGNLLWKYHHNVRPGYVEPINVFQTKRALAIGGNKVILGTMDMHVVALDVKTGNVVWDVATDDDPKSTRVYNGGPLVVNGKVIIGSSGCAAGGMTYSVSCFVGGYDLETGKQLWKFNTLAQPGEPGGDTWNNLPAEKRWGGSVGIVPSYDPELNLLYVGTGTPYPWSSVQRGTKDPVGGGKNGDGLYMNSTLALNPDTGKLVWYYQHMPNDDFDQDYAFERILAPVTYQGAKRKAVITAGKPGVIEMLDAKTGEFLLAKDPGMQNIFTIDPKTGVKTQLLPSTLAPGMKRCPGNGGARNFMPGSYDPVTNRYYISMNDTCTGKGGDMPERSLGLDLNTMEFAMDIKSREVTSTGKMSTAGGLLFSATGDRYFRALDSRDGKVLWQARVQDIPNGAPVTYMVDGKQYIALIAGNPGITGNGTARSATENVRPEGSVALWVWQLP